MVTNNMQALRVNDYGEVDQLVVDQISTPKPKSGEVLIRVFSAGVNPIDWKLFKYPINERPLTFPYTPGIELAGIIESVGPGVKAFKKGQAVFGTTMGSHAEYAIAPEKTLFLKPENVTFDQATTIPIGARTAWIGLFILADLQEGQQVLVHGAAGGVGIYVVQLARWKNAHVIGTSSSENLEFVSSLGAESVIDYNVTPFEEVVHDVDVVVDAVGGDVEDRSWQVLKEGGILISLTGPASTETAEQHSVRVASTNQSPQLAALIKTDPLLPISKLVASGDIVPQVGSIFSLDNAVAAYRLSELGHGRGRIIIHITD